MAMKYGQYGGSSSDNWGQSGPPPPPPPRYSGGSGGGSGGFGGGSGRNSAAAAPVYPPDQGINKIALWYLYESGLQDEYQFLRIHRKRTIHKLMTEDWAIIQGRYNWTASDLWAKAIELLELDLSACEELMCLVHQGVPGRTEANFILWTLLTQAYSGDPEDLSRLCSTKIRAARQFCDRPSKGQQGANTWCWNRYITPREGIKHFAPDAVPQDPQCRLDANGNPLPPPDCWAPAAPAPPPENAPAAPTAEAPPPATPEAPAGETNWGWAPPQPQLPGRGSHRPLWL